ncbi:phospholipase A2 inhibitor gamma subunit B-like [Lithobates pipiens]
MIRYFLFFVLFFALLATGRGLTCRECSTSSGAFCRGRSHKCPSVSTSCMKRVSITKMGDKLFKSFSRGCNDDEDLCNKDFIMNSGAGNVQIRVVTKCCHQDNCNKCKIKIPPYNNTRNHIICPVCYKYETYECKHKGYIECRGHENECFDFAATVLRKGHSSMKYAKMGCTTSRGCSLGHKIIPGISLTDIDHISCKAGVPITH